MQSSLEEFKHSLQEIQNDIHKTEKLYSVEDIHQQININIESLKQLLIQ